MQLQNKKTIWLSVLAVAVFGVSATFGYSLIQNRNIQDTAVKSKAASVAPSIPTTNYTVPGGAIYMSPTGNDANNGTSGAPVKTLARANSLVPSGGTVVVRGGTYRDGKLNTSKPVTFQAAPGEQPWFDGTDVMTGWQQSGSTWYIDGWYTPDFCGGQYYNYPYDGQIDANNGNKGPCNHFDMAKPIDSNPIAGSPQMAFVNGVALKEVTSLAGVTSGTFYYDKTSQRFSIGTSPIGATVELAKRPTAMVLTGTSSAIKGIGFKRFASNEYNNITEAPVFVSGASSLIENSVFWANAGYGLGLSNPTNQIVRSSQFVSNGFNGMTANGHHADGAVDNLLIENSIFDGNNTEKFGENCKESCAQAGVKLGHMNGGTVRNNIFSNNIGYGFWCDLYCTNMKIVGNIASNNLTRSGILYEVSSNGIIASNILVGNGKYGLMVSGPNNKIYNNTILGNTRIGLEIYDDSRVPSGTEVPADSVNNESVNNIIQAGTDFMLWVSGYQTTYDQIISKMDYNSYYRSGTTPTIGFKSGSSATAVWNYHPSVAKFTAATGWDAHSQDIVNQSNPYFTNAGSGDYRVRADSVAYKSGAPLPADVAAAIGVPAGVAVDRGALKWVGMPGGVVTPPPAPTDTTAPVTTISTPANNSSGKGTISISGSATDNVAVTKVELLVDGAVKATDSVAPFASFSWDSTSVADGARTIAFKAYDAAGNAANSPNVIITVTNTVPPPLPVIVSFTANPSTVIAGGQSQLSWVTQNASSCDVNPGGTQGTTALNWQTPALTTVGTKTYTLTCYNTAVQSVSKTLTVTVAAAPTPPSKPVFTADKSSVQSGGSVTFSWSSTGATSCVFNPGNIGGAATVNGKVVSNITTTTTYSLACQNNAGTTQANPITVTVTAAPVPVPLPSITSFTADKSNIGYGQSTTLRWATTGVIASGCRLNPGTEQGPSGSITTGDLIASTSYTLTCKNSENKTVSASVSVIVAGKPAPVNPAPITPNVDPSVASAQSVTNTQSSQKIANASVTEQVSGLASLDISNVVDTEKEKAILYVEYYDGEQLIEKVTTAPFALNTTLLKNGSYSITERTYFIDGTNSEVTKVLGVENVAGVVTVVKQPSAQFVPILLWVVAAIVVIAAALKLTQKYWLPVLDANAPLLAQKLRSIKLRLPRKKATASIVPSKSVDDSVVVIQPDKKDK